MNIFQAFFLATPSAGAVTPLTRRSSRPAWTFAVFILAPSARAAERGRWASTSSIHFLNIYNWCIFMRTIKFTSWQDDNFFIGFLNDYPDYLTQGMSREELAENLRSLLVDLESDEIPYVRKVEELMVA